jgi:hypothetical protein
MPELQMNDDQLALALVDVGARIAWPTTTDLRARVVSRIAEPQRIPWWRAFASPRHGFAPAIITIALALLAVLAFSPEARATATDILRLRGVEIFRGPVPSPSPSRSPGTIQSLTPFPATGLGVQVTLDEAKARAGFPVVVPTDPLLSAPDEVYLRTTSSGSTAVSFVYVARTGITTSAQVGVAAIFTEFAGATVDENFFGKVLDQTTTLEKVAVNGQPGFWIQGTPHFFFYNGGGGNVQQETLRLAGNTLIWVQGNLLLRFEAQVDRATALRIAGSLR